MKRTLLIALGLMLAIPQLNFVFGNRRPTRMVFTAPPAPKFADAERQTELARRRAEVAKRLGAKGILILFSAEPRIYSNDVDFLYRQENNLYYLTNLRQNNATLIITNDGTKTSEILFLPARNPARETWNGKMYSREDAKKISGIETIVDASEFQTFYDALKAKTAFTSKDGVGITNAFDRLYLLLPEADYDGNGKREFAREFEKAKDFASVTTDTNTKTFLYKPNLGFSVENARPIFAEMRLTKSPMELRLLQHAIDVTTEAQMRAMSMVGRAKYEYEVQAEVEYVFRRRNADYWGYPSIVGCGPNATTLHYVESQGEIKDGNLLLMDVGAEYDHYTADVTRTFPVSGKFSKEQAEIYQIVFDAQEAVYKAIKPGAKMKDLEKVSRDTVEIGLTKLGLIEGPGALVPGTEREVPNGKGGTEKVGLLQSRVWFMHGNGHWLGMNVHDVGSYQTAFAPGMVFTNEPGIYIREDALDYLQKKPETEAWVAKVRPVFEKYKSIGVRIEDDMLVTATGAEWMTKNLPRSIGEIERFMASAPAIPVSKFIPHKIQPQEFSLLAFTRQP